MTTENTETAPPWHTTHWFNAETPVTLDQLRGKVVVLHAFQMLCPACVLHGLPQSQAVHDTFDREDVAVVGLHTVFEHHGAMTPDALAAFIHEYRLSFPIGVDEPHPNLDVPRTMQAYGLRGTPSLILIDRSGRLRRHSFGRVPDLQLGADIAALVGEVPRKPETTRDPAPIEDQDQQCSEDGCAL